MIDGQITIDEWLGLEPKTDELDELIRAYIIPKGYTLDNMAEKIDDAFRLYSGGCWSNVCFEFSHNKAMFSKGIIFNGYTAWKGKTPGVYVLTRTEYFVKVRKILEHEARRH